MKKLFFSSSAVLGLLLGLPTPIAFAHGGNASLIHACVQQGSQQVRIVGPSEACRGPEAPLHWNITGPQGPAGPTLTIVRQGEPVLIFPRQDGQSVAECLPDEKATGGGYHTFPVEGRFPWSVIVRTSYPSSIGGLGPDTWIASAINNDPTGQTISLSAYIVCASP